MNIMTRPVFKSHLQVSVIPGEGVLLLFEAQAWALHGKVYELLAPLMDGSRDADALVDALAGEVDAAKVHSALALLEQKGHIAEDAPENSEGDGGLLARNGGRAASRHGGGPCQACAGACSGGRG